VASSSNCGVLAAAIVLAVISIQAAPSHRPPSGLQFDRIVDLALAVEPAALASLSADGEAEVPARLSIRGDAGAASLPVTLKIKGQLGSKRSIGEKAAFKIDVLDGRRALGFDHLTLNNMVQDPTMMHETLAYRVYAAAGVPVPETSYARVTLDGEPYGLYLLVETVDRQFLRRQFGDDSGILYEGAYGSDLNEGDAEKFDLDEGADPNRAMLKQLIHAVASKGEAVFYGESALVDTPSFVSMMAVAVLINDWDNYYRSNNYRIYWNPAARRWYFIPTGLDQTFTHHEVKLFGGTGTLFRKCLEFARCRQDYLAAVERTVDLFERLQLAAAMDHLFAAIGPAANADPKKPYDADAMASARRRMRQLIADRPAQVRKDLD
jgi:CotH protein